MVCAEGKVRYMIDSISDLLKPYRTNIRKREYIISRDNMNKLQDAYFVEIHKYLSWHFDNLLNLGLINLDALDERERKIMVLRHLKRMNLEDIGREYGVTRERIRTIEAGAIYKLRRRVKKNHVAHEQYEA